MARGVVCLVALAATTNAFFTGTPLRARVAPLNMAAKKQGTSKTKADPISDECSADDVSAPVVAGRGGVTAVAADDVVAAAVRAYACRVGGWACQSV